MARRILYIQYTNPAGYPPLEHSSRILADAGWSVRFLGTHGAGVEALEFPVHPRIDVLRIPLAEPGWKQKLHYLYYCLWVLWHVAFWRPTWIYASDPLSAPIALLLTFAPWTKVLYHEHDSPSPSYSGSTFIKICLVARRRLARQAALCVLPNETRAEQFRRSVGGACDVQTVWNCPRVDEVTERREVHHGRLTVLYHGSIVPIRLPRTVIHALALLPDSVELVVVGYETVGALGYVQELATLAVELGISQRIHFQAAVPRAKLLEFCRTCHVGLSLMPVSTDDINEQAMIGASNKTFDYMACGLSLLVTDLPEWSELLVDPGFALTCDPEDATSVAAVLRLYLDNPEEQREMGERGRRKVLSEWNYERQFAPVFQRLHDGATRRVAPQYRVK